MFGNAGDAFGGRERLRLGRQKLEREELRKDDEIRAVIGRDIDEIFDLALELVVPRDLAHLKLNGRHPDGVLDGNRIRLKRGPLGRLGIERIVPCHMGREAERIVIVGVVILEDAERLEPVGEMKPDRLVARLAVDHRIQKILRVGIGPPPPRIPRHPAAKDDALEAETFAESLAGGIKPLADPQPAVRGVDADFHPVQPVPVWIVAGGKPVAGDLVPAMRFQRDLTGDDEGRAMADDFAIKLGNELTLGKIIDLAPYHALRMPGRGRVDTPAERCHRCHVA